ncbi:MAG: alpha/beta hydrolase [Burkholderiales bacterium]
MPSYKNIPEFGPLTKGSPKGLVIALHGWGSNGEDLIALAPHFAAMLPEVKFISPHAPEVCDMAPTGRQWFSLREWTEKAMLEGLRSASIWLNDFIDKQRAHYCLQDNQIALVGFSQGTMTALHVGLRRPNALAGILGYSGALVAPDLLGGELKAKPPVCLIHGNLDTVVPYQALQIASDALNHHNIAVETYTMLNIPHSINLHGLEKGKNFLAQALNINP